MDIYFPKSGDNFSVKYISFTLDEDYIPTNIVICAESGVLDYLEGLAKSHSLIENNNLTSKYAKLPKFRVIGYRKRVAINKSRQVTYYA